MTSGERKKKLKIKIIVIVSAVVVAFVAALILLSMFGRVKVNGVSLHGCPCVVPVEHLRFFLCLSGGNLFTDWATMVASLLGPQPDAVVVVCWTSKKN